MSAADPTPDATYGGFGVRLVPGGSRSLLTTHFHGDRASSRENMYDTFVVPDPQTFVSEWRKPLFEQLVADLKKLWLSGSWRAIL